MISLPDELPEKPTGWTKRMAMHLNMGRDGHAGVYKIFNEHGKEMPVGWQYHTKDSAANGFTLPDVPACMSWAELREMWPIWKERHPETDPLAVLEDME